MEEGQESKGDIALTGQHQRKWSYEPSRELETGDEDQETTEENDNDFIRRMENQH